MVLGDQVVLKANERGVEESLERNSVVDQIEQISEVFDHFADDIEVSRC